MSEAIDVCDLSRVFPADRFGSKTITALAAVNLRVAGGEVHGLLGPNGAGKTTLCKILATILLPSSGSARVCGYDVVDQADEVRRQIGLVLGGDRGLYVKLTADQNLQFWAAMYGLARGETAQRIRVVLDRVGLSGVTGNVEKFSRGMKQRLHLARGLLADPAVLILDEPTIGLDPAAAIAFRDLVRDVAGRHTTILMTTHDMQEAEAVCDRVSLINEGRIIATESPRSLSALISTFERIDVSDLDASTADTLAVQLGELPGVATTCVTADGTLRIETCASGAVSHVLRFLLDHGHVQVSVGRPALSEVYMHLIGDRGMQVR
jgi:ABC-2 type transport system ATP-binding protein